MPNWFRKLIHQRLFHAILIALAMGMVSLGPFASVSYDISFRFRPHVSITNVAVIYANHETLEILGAEHGSLSRTNHARMMNLLKAEGAGLIFYDVAFIATNPIPEADDVLAQAVAAHGAVVLVTAGETRWEQGIPIQRVVPLIPALRALKPAWGHAELPEGVVRQISGDFSGVSYAAWVAASSVARGGLASEDRNAVRWLNYYGPPNTGTFPVFYFHALLSTNPLPTNAFRGKTVFVGQDRPIGKLGTARDTFRTPYSESGMAWMPGVAIHATAYTNLVRNEWLRKLHKSWERLVAGIWGAMIAVLLFKLSRKGLSVLIPVALVAAVLLGGGSLYVQWHYHVWWSWFGPALIQTAAVLVFACVKPPLDIFISYRRDPDHETALLHEARLSARGFTVFMDRKKLVTGEFGRQLLRGIERCRFVVVILSPGCLSLCVHKDDWLRQELDRAYDLKKTMVPIFKDGFDFDKEPPGHVPDLPSIRKLKRSEGREYSGKHNFDAYLSDLVKLLKQNPETVEGKQDDKDDIGVSNATSRN